jgi:hypothetical protein
VTETEVLKFREVAPPPQPPPKVYLDMESWPTDILVSDYFLVENSSYLSVKGGILKIDVENGYANYRDNGRSPVSFTRRFHLVEGIVCRDGLIHHQDEVNHAYVRPADGEGETSLARSRREGRDGAPTSEADDRRGTAPDGSDPRPRGDW